MLLATRPNLAVKAKKKKGSLHSYPSYSHLVDAAVVCGLVAKRLLVALYDFGALLVLTLMLERVVELM